MLHIVTQRYTLLHSTLLQCYTMLHIVTRCYTLLHSTLLQCYTMLHIVTNTVLHIATRCYTHVHCIISACACAKLCYPVTSMSAGKYSKVALVEEEQCEDLLQFMKMLSHLHLCIVNSGLYCYSIRSSCLKLEHAPDCVAWYRILCEPGVGSFLQRIGWQM